MLESAAAAAVTAAAAEKVCRAEIGKKGSERTKELALKHIRRRPFA